MPTHSRPPLHRPGDSLPGALPSRRKFLGIALAGGAAELACRNGETGPVRIGYFANLTHAAALLATERALFANELAASPHERYLFNAGPSAVEALLSGGLDIAYLGPNPAINAHVKSRGQAIRAIAGATSGGASLVVAPSITSASDLAGKSVGSPQLGGTQDVALRAWLRAQGLRTDAQGGGDVSILPQENAQLLESFRGGSIAGAWVPEPWATRLVLEAGGKILVDERTLWPEGRFCSALVVARTAFLHARRADAVSVLRAHVRATQLLTSDPTNARTWVLDAMERETGKRLTDALIAQAWTRLEFSTRPLPESLEAAARSAAELDLLELGGVDLSSLWDQSLLTEADAAVGKSAGG